MSDRVALLGGRTFPRLALTGLAVVWLAGCSTDVTRFADSPSPFVNPFSGSQTAGAAPSAKVAATPLAPPGQSLCQHRAGGRRPCRAAGRRLGGWMDRGWRLARRRRPGRDAGFGFEPLRRSRVGAFGRQWPFERRRNPQRHAHRRAGLSRKRRRDRCEVLGKDGRRSFGERRQETRERGRGARRQGQGRTHVEVQEGP